MKALDLLADMLKLVRLRGFNATPIQSGRVEAHGSKAADDAMRIEDYGFSARAVDGQGLAINAGGFTVVLRMDRLEGKPSLAPFEVCVWHKDGHKITLGAGGNVTVDCVDFVVNASGSAKINSPSLTHNGVNVGDTHTHPQNNGNHYGGDASTSAPQ
jgi:phage gp45-like